MKIEFSVSGIPRPKQSVKKGKNRKTGETVYYTPARIKEWQNEVSWRAKETMAGTEPLQGKLAVIMHFRLPDNRRRDLDNLSKAMLDGCNRIVFNDDQQVCILVLVKDVSKETGVDVIVLDTITVDEIVFHLRAIVEGV